jgi:thiol-disulfide isomerase/thioredoxin
MTNTARAAVAVAALAGIVGCGSPPAPAPPAPPPPTEVMHQPVTGTNQLKPGDRLPPLTAGGWVNGPPPKPDDPGVRLLVVDVWGLWCPYCRSHAPVLLRLHEKYADRGVRFVSLTNTPEGGVLEYAKQTKTPWPSGFDAPPETITALGAGSGIAMNGYQIAPTVYLVGPDGKVRWSDDRARFRHKDAVPWEKELDDAVADELGLTPAKPGR